VETQKVLKIIEKNGVPLKRTVLKGCTIDETS